MAPERIAAGGQVACLGERNAVRDCLHRLVLGTQCVRTTLPLPEAPEAEELQSGARHGQVLVDLATARHRGTMEALRTAATRDIEVRVTAGALHRMVVFDDRYALVPFDLLRLDHGAYLFQSGSAAPYRQLFGLLWGKARTPRAAGIATGGLSGREAQAARLLVHGATDHQVANQLQVSPRTVRTIVSRLQHRYGTCSRMALGFHLAHDKALTTLFEREAG